MFPETRLPYSSSVLMSLFRSRCGFPAADCQVGAGETRFYQPPPRREIMIANRQCPNAVQVVRQENDGGQVERAIAANVKDCFAKTLSRQARSENLSPPMCNHGEEICAPRDVIPPIVAHFRRPGYKPGDYPPFHSAGSRPGLPISTWLRSGLLASCIKPSDRSASNHLLPPLGLGLVLPESLPRDLPTASLSRTTASVGLRHYLAGSPRQPAESSSSSCGPVVHLQLLSTPSHEDAVTFGYKIQTIFRQGLSPVDLIHSQAH